MWRKFVSQVLACVVLAVPCGARHRQPADDPHPSLPLSATAAAGPVATFSIVAYDPEAKEWGVGVASKFLAVGAVVPYARAGVGAVATQSYANVLYGPEGLKLLGGGRLAPGCIDALVAADERRDLRQVGVVDRDGNSATFTGLKCNPWAGGKTGKHYACQGNLLAGPEVVDAMAKAFENTTGPLVWRLLAALEGAEKAGGDKRGRQSAAVLVVRENAGYGGNNDRLYDFRVDDHPQPVAELARIVALRVARAGKVETRPRRSRDIPKQVEKKK